VPPAVALLYYISSVILRRIFCPTGIFRGVFLYIICRKEQRSCDGQGTLYFLGCRTALNKGAMERARGEEFYIWKSLWSSEKIYASGSRVRAWREPFCFWKFRGVFSVYFVGRRSEAAMGGPRTSYRARRSSVGAVQHSSVGCSVAQKGAA
jgi:hypothetical protein